MLDGPLEAGREGRALAPQVGAQDADRDELDLRRQAQDDAAAGGAVAEEVVALVRDDVRLALAVELDGDALDDTAAEGGMAALEAAVEDGHADTVASWRPRRPTLRSISASGGRRSEPLPGGRRERLRPGRDEDIRHGAQPRRRDGAA